ncbi:hypothetical protein RHS01_05184 [Rhizoctonia solani]|uniref:Uncharacterized protein n=1 Tax=Rhizoctonia solani TaxID=456999 RepID=A0A8H7M520_9AGAM|nr:hypothetical protein RHS01_05184 [Rhizoctonia solani]
MWPRPRPPLQPQLTLPPPTITTTARPNTFSRSPASTSSQVSDPPRQYFNPHKGPPPFTHFPSTESHSSAEREDDHYESIRTQKEQQESDAHVRRARLIAEKNATLKRMEERQLKAQSQSWFEESQRLATEDAHKKDDECRRRRKSAGWNRRKLRSEGHIAPDESAGKARERVDKNQPQRPNSPSSVADAWATYEKACAELMGANPSDEKMKSSLNFYTIPWPVLGQAKSFHDLTSQSIAAFILSPHHSQGKTPRARLRAAILVWHPDKFAQKVLPRVTDSHRLAVSAGSDIIARVLTELISTHGN